MSTQTAYKKYKETQVKTANQGKLIIMLYQGAIKFLRFAKKSIKEHDINQANEALIRAQDIITELNTTLDEEKGGDIARNLSSLYVYMKRRLMQANLKKDTEIIDEVEDLLTGLLDSWKEVATKTNNKNKVEDMA